jgi:hypothetical protein
VTVPAYTRFDLTAAYKQPKYDVRLNVYNLFNTMYYDGVIASDGGRAVPWAQASTGDAYAQLSPVKTEAGRSIMLVCIPQCARTPRRLVSLRERLDRANSWVDGRVTAGYQGAPVKFNQQIDERSRNVAIACQRIVVSALERPSDRSSAPCCRTRSIRRCSIATARG